MAHSLLAHLFPYIKGSHEDIATFSLQYLLSQSVHLNCAFTKYVSDVMSVELGKNLQYLCQVTGEGEEKERPDMVGVGGNGVETVLFEMKFYASLTQNQPSTYLKRLVQNGGKGLVFICPMGRRTSLWTRLKECCGELLAVSQFCIETQGIRLAIITWTEVLELLKRTASSLDPDFITDVNQLEGYCHQIDSDAFIPFSADDLSAKMAKMEERYYQVVDEVIDLLMADASVITSKKGLKAAGYRKGYTRSLHLDKCTITLCYDRNLWSHTSSVETPFWVAIRDNSWNQSGSILDYLRLLPDRNKDLHWDMVFIGLEALQNATFEEVCEDLAQQILRHIQNIQEYLLGD